eukprot:SAG11_NODE_562_length_8523_cov_38.875356_9_plen_107_part_00
MSATSGRARSPSPAGSGVSIQSQLDFDAEDLPFDVQDVDKKVYVLKGRNGGMFLEWDQCHTEFRRKQGYGNALKLTRRRQEDLASFVNRAVKEFEYGKKHYASRWI